MSADLNSKVVRFGLILTLVSLSLALLSSHAFLHVHVTSDGRIIAHSHPSQDNGSEKTGPAKHSHSNLEFCYFQNVSTFDKFILPVVLKEINPFAEFQLMETVDETAVRFVMSFDYSLRAPPFCTSS